MIISWDSDHIAKTAWFCRFALYNIRKIRPFRNNYYLIMIKFRWALFVTYTIIQSITSSEICSLHLTHPSAHTLGAVGSRHCGARGAVGSSVPCSRVSPQSWTIPAGAEIRNPQPRVTSPTLYPLKPRLNMQHNSVFKLISCPDLTIAMLS